MIALLHSELVPAHSLLLLRTSVRKSMRRVPAIAQLMPSEQRVKRCKLAYADQYGTRTAVFATGAYLSDPIRFVNTVTAGSQLIVVGGDCGDGRTKLGITYTVRGIQHFAALLVCEQSDGPDELAALKQPGLTPFTGDSTAFADIFAVLQHLITQNRAYLNGDWPFLNAVLGLMSPSASHPCPICIVSKSHFLFRARTRQATDRHSRGAVSPLLTIEPERIVPTPLHIYLGVGNRIILDVHRELFGEALVDTAVKRIKTVHTVSGGGASSVHDLTGPELTKFLKLQCRSGLLHAAASAPHCPSDVKATHSILKRWLERLQSDLLRSEDWTPTQLFTFSATVDDIWKHWQCETHIAPFPKLHMLRHAVEFAERWRFLGRASEAQVESFHHTFKKLFHQHHHNQSRNPAERLRRSLADTALAAVEEAIG